jgi:hypothetical protein
MVMAFGEDGKQVPEYQGHGRDIIPKLRRDFPHLVIEGKDWDTDFRALPSWIHFFGMDWGG